MPHPTTPTTPPGLPMPRILYGTAWKEERTAHLVEQAIGQGFRGIDTACQPKHYHEAGVGAGLARLATRGIRREELYLQSKFTPLAGHDPRRIPYDPRAPLAEQVGQSLQTSLANLHTSYLDGLVLHSPLGNPDQFLEVWRAMERIHREGGARLLGISNCHHLEQLEFLHANATVKPAILQNRFYADSGYDGTLRHFCRHHGITYQGFWTLTANPHLLAHPTLRELAGHHGRTVAQIFYRFLCHLGIVPLIGTTSTTHMSQDLAIFEFELTPAEVARVESLL